MATKPSATKPKPAAATEGNNHKHKATYASIADEIRDLTHSVSQNKRFSTGAIDHRNNTSAPSGHEFYAGGLGLASATTSNYTPRAFGQIANFAPTAAFGQEVPFTFAAPFDPLPKDSGINKGGASMTPATVATAAGGAAPNPADHPITKIRLVTPDDDKHDKTIRSATGTRKSSNISAAALATSRREKIARERRRNSLLPARAALAVPSAAPAVGRPPRVYQVRSNRPTGLAYLRF